MKTQQQLDNAAQITDIIELIVYGLVGAAVVIASIYALCATAGIVPLPSL
tara:strand:+ start:398 stop:547 length:150 start_codon:yes stop_codon:yes gene_type:complete